MSKKNLKTSIGADTIRKIKSTAQETIPFAEVYENGLILNYRKKGTEVYSLAFSLENINYLMLKDSDKQKKMDAYIAPLNALPSDISYQEICFNVPLNTKSLQETIAGEKLPDETEYDRTYIANQQKFIKNIREQKTETKLYFALSYKTKSRSDNPYNILMQNYLKISTAYSEIGIRTEVLTVKERLHLFHDLYNPYSDGDFQLPADMYKKGQSIQDYIAPSVFNFKPNKFTMGAANCRCFFVRAFSETIDDEFITDLTDNEFRIAVSKHIKLLDKSIAEKLVGNRLKDLETSRQTRNQRNARNGTNYIPYDLKKNIDACEQLLDKLNQSEELYFVSIYIFLASNSPEELENDTKSLKGICQRHHVSLLPVTFRQEEALNSVLPLAQDDLELGQYLLSSGVACLLPFSYDRVFSPTGFFYGVNTVSKTPIIIDRKADKNGNAYYLGKSGSGKSMYSKMEIEDILHQTEEDRVIIIDPEREYVKQTLKHGGSVIKISAGTKNFINPFDFFGSFGESEDTIREKADLITSLFEIFKNAPLNAVEKSIIDRCVQLSYKPYLTGGMKRDDIPTFVEFDKILLQQPETTTCHDLHLYLEMYITGSVNIFSHRTNVDLSSRIIDFDLRDLGENLKRAGMLIVVDFIQQQVFKNFELGLWTWLYVDEFQTFYDEDSNNKSCSVFFEKMFARFRKYGGIATGLTQNITNVLKSHSAVSMLQNSQFVVLFEQATNNLEEIARIYDLSEKQCGKLVNTKRGEGLLVSQNIVRPFSKIYPDNNIIYDTITSSFQDKISQMENAQSKCNSNFANVPGAFERNELHNEVHQ